MRVNFDKMHGTMNDFVVFHDPDGRVTLSPEMVRSICNRRTGVGADGVIAVRPSATADFFMDYVNADGSLAEMCGNGIRCLAKFVHDNGLTEKQTIPVETRAGIKTVELSLGPDRTVEKVRVNMGAPIFDPKMIPVNLHTDGSPILDHPVEAEGRLFLASMVSMGNPHAVIILEESPDTFPGKFGASLERHPLFPQRTNVEFVRVVDRTRLEMRVWERGSGETLACGTGACAAAVVARLKGLVEERCVVGLSGGDLDIEWKNNNYPVLMKGTASKVFEGVITI